MIARAVSTNVRCRPIERTPRVVTAISEPIAASETETTASATSTSIRVKPPSLSLPRLRGRVGWGRLNAVVRNNLDPSGEPVDADLIADAKPRQRDRATARHAGCEEADRLAGRALIATRRQQRIERHIVRHADDAPGCAGAHDTLRRVDLGHDLHVVADRGIAVRLEHRGGLDRKRFQARPRSAARQRRDHDRGEDRYDREYADELEQREALDPASVASW